MSDNDDSPDLVYLGLRLLHIAYDIKDERLSPLAKNIKDRIDRLKSDETRLPIKYFETSKKMTAVYRESIICYLLGMPNSCFPSIVSVLEHVLRTKYTNDEGKSGNKLSLNNLVDWAIKPLGNTDEANSFRIIRNRIHDDRPISLSDCAEAIRHITRIINKWYTGGEVRLKIKCFSCGRIVPIILSDHDALFIGADLLLKCTSCGYVNNGVALTGPIITRPPSGKKDSI